MSLRYKAIGWNRQKKIYHGARVCGPPAIDRQFKTVDFLMLFDVLDMPPRRLRNFVR